MKKFKKLLVMLLTFVSVATFVTPVFAEETTGTGTPDPGTTDPGTTDPGTTDPGTTEEENPVVSINGRDLYNSIELALAAATTGDKIELIQNITLENDVTIPRGLTLASVANELSIPDGKTLTVNGSLAFSGTSTLSNSGVIALENDGKIIIDSTFKLNSGSQLQLKNGSIIDLTGTLDSSVNSKIVTESTGTFTVNVKSTGALVGNANTYDTAKNLTINNYGGRVNEQITLKLNDGNYNNYVLYSEGLNKYYKTLDEVTGPAEIMLLSPLTVNGNAKINEGVTLKLKTGNKLYINGTLTVDGVIDFSTGYAPLVTSNLYGNGKVYINAATEMETGYWTYVTILKDVSTTLTFETISGYNARLDDVLFELGTNDEESIAIAAKIKLGESFNGLVINPKNTTLNKINGGWNLGVTANEIIDNIEDAKNPETGFDNTFLLGFITFSALICAAFCARRIYILNRI